MMDPSTITTLLAFDYGLKNVGVAIGNTLTQTARPLKTIRAIGNHRWQEIANIITEWQPDALVVGIPLYPDGNEHENTQRARKFARQLHGRFHLQVYEADERYTTVKALEMGAAEDVVDAYAAAIILEQYLQNSCA